MFWGHVQGCGAGQRAAGRRRFVLVRLLAGLAGGSLVLAGVAGCDGAEADPDPGPVEPPVVGSTTEDGANAGDAGDDDSGVDEDDGASGPQEYEHPVPGPDFDDDGQAGAEAAAVYFVELYSYLYATGDFEAWDELTTDECNFCRGVSEDVAEIYERGGWMISEPPTIMRTSSQLDPNVDGAFVAEVEFIDHAAQVYNGAGELESTYPRAETIAWVRVSWAGGQWNVLGAEGGELTE